MNRHMFYMPFAYFLGTRLAGWSAKISWLLIYFVPLVLVVFAFSPSPEPAQIVTLLLATTCTYCLYELGYIENDTLTIQNEKHPTLRLDPEQLEYVADYWLVIVLVRLVLSGVLLSLLATSPGFVPYLLSLVCLGLVFPIYNRRRGAINAWLHPILVSVRFCGPLLLLLPELTVLIFSLLLFPVLNSLERAREPRYNLKPLQTIWFANSGSGRWGYYLVVSVFWALFCWWQNVPLLTLLPLLYFFLYRLLSPLAVKRGAE